MSSMLVPVTGSRLKPLRIGDLDDVGDAEVAGTVTMSGRGTMTSRTIVSPNSSSDSMSSALLGLDHLVLDGQVGDGEQLLLGDERALLQALAGEDHVGEADEAREIHRSGGNAGQGGDRPGGAERGPLGVLDGPRLRRHLGEDEEHGDVEHGDGDEARAAGREVAEDQRLDRLAGEHDEQQRVEPLLVLDEPQQGRAPPAVVSASAWALGWTRG